jgi:hypothetical protein
MVRINYTLSMKFFAPVALFFAIVYSYIVKVNSVCSSVECQSYELIYWIVSIFLISMFFYINPTSLKIRDKKNLILSGSLLLFLVLFNWENLNASLVSDHIYHAQEALRNFLMLAERYCNQNLPYCSTVPFATVVNFYSRNFAGILFVILFLLTQAQRRIFLAIASVVTFYILLQFFKHEQIQSGDIHPPLRLAPLWIASTLWGIKILTFRIVGIVAVFVFAIFSMDFFSRSKGLLNSFLVVTVISTIPILQHVAYIVEPSLWTTLSWTGLLLFISFGEKNSNNFSIWFFILSIASLMRVSAFVAIIPLGLYWIKFSYERFGIRFLAHKDFYIPMLPILAMLPFTVRSILYGTPATEGEASKLTLLLLSVNSLLPVKVAYYSIMLPWIAFFPIGFISRGEDKLVKFLIKCIFFILAYIVFYSIRDALWGLSRYQAEFILPFVIVGILNFVFYIKEKSKHLFYFALFILFSWNIWVSAKFQSYTDLQETSIFTGLRDGRSAGVSEIVYDTRSALISVRDRGLLSATYLDGITYGHFPQLMVWANFSELQEIKAMGNPWGGLKMEEVHANQKIKAVILSDWEPNRNKLQKLISFNWKLVETFENQKYKTKTYLLIRN